MTADARDVGLRVVLGVLAVYHLGVGFLSCLSTAQTVRFGRVFYGLKVEVLPQTAYMLKALGIYALFTGLLLGAALSDPVRLRPVILAAILLLLLRAATRLAFRDTLREAFGVSRGRNLWNAVLMAAQAALLAWWLPR
ncbi:MAG: hypothetical protein HY722_04255 [Planctomycetes bacterium]|nr:hypothetical protein [Planctomycetota bacterium]